MKVIAVGDLSFKGGEEVNTKKNFDNIVKQNPDLVIALGDLSYKNKADPFVDAIINIDNEKIKPLIGNHDDDEKLNNDDADNFWKLLRDKYLKPFGVNKPYYNFIKENVYFIVLYTNPEFIADEEQLQFAKDKLIEASSNPIIEWIIVCYHKPSVTSNTVGGHSPEAGFAKIYHSLFDEFGVDLIITGHNHNYQRSKLVKHNPENSTVPNVVEDGNENYDTRKGRVFMVVGTGGRKLENFDGNKEEYIKFRYPEEDQDSYGILSIEFQTNKKMIGKFIANDDEGSIIDSFIIDKSLEPPL
jgi:calcineurin-like phosphoesterase family protein/glutaredoxin